jgi:hypothetical protein
VQAGIEASPLATYLTDDWSDWVPEEKLQRLRSLLTTPETASGLRPDPAAVAAIVEKTQAEMAAPPKSLWQRFKDWLRSLLDDSTKSEKGGWFSEWLDEHLPGGQTLAMIGYLLLAGIIAAIGWVIYSELRAMGMFGGRGSRRVAGAPAAAAAPAAPTLAGASEAEAPSILLTLLVGELRRLGRVQDKLSMTHRELGRAARFDAVAEGAAFHDVLGAAERLRYDVTPPPAGALQPIIEAGRRLLENLSRQARSAA